jgi:hypothetical protein
VKTKFHLFESQIDDVSLILGEDKDFAKKKIFNDLKDSLSEVSPFNRLDDSDWKDIYEFFEERNATSVLLADEIFFKFVKISSQIGFPMTQKASKSAGLTTDRFDNETIISALVGAGVLSVFDIPASDAIKTTKRTKEEDDDFKKNPTSKVRIYDYSKDLISSIGRILSKLGLKKESVSLVEYYEGRKKLNYENIISEADDRMAKIMSRLCGKSAMNESIELDDELIEGFVDAILLRVAEMERTGLIEPVVTAEDAKEIVLSVIKKMYKKQGLISKMSSKFARFGSKRALIAGRLDILNALK